MSFPLWAHIDADSVHRNSLHALMTLADFYSSEPAWFISSVFLLSLLIGSFLNVVTHRLPIMMERQWKAEAASLLNNAATSEPTAHSPQPSATTYNLVVPRSACPHCGAPITALQNIPIISWCWLRGRCAKCGAPISPRYPLVELLTAVLSGVVAWRFGWSFTTAAVLVLTWYLIAMSMIDVDHQLLPDSMTLPLMWLGLLLSVVGGVLPPSPSEAIVGAVAGYLSLWSVFHLFKLLTGKEGMGYGDFKLLAALGAWMGWKMLFLIVLLSACSGAVIGIAMIVLRGRDRQIPIPFGPYLSIAGWIAMLWGDGIVSVYLSSLS